MKAKATMFIGHCGGCGKHICLACAGRLAKELQGAVTMCREKMSSGHEFRHERWQKVAKSPASHGAAMTPRPSRWDDAVVAAGVDVMWPRIAESGGADAPTDPAEVESYKSDLRVAFRHNEDGYEVGRYLEGCGWYMDAEMVEALDNGGHAIYRAEQAAVRAWVAAGGVSVDLPAGTKVRHPSLNGHVGEIVVRDSGYDYRADGTYLVFCEALGHTRDADTAQAMRDRKSVTHGVILRAECIEVVT